MPLPTCPAWSARRCRRRCRGRTWSRGRGRSWGRGSWTGSWAAAAHTPAAGRSCSRSENITITIKKYLLEKQLLYYFSLFSCYLLCGCNSGAVGTCDQVELLDHCIGGIVPLHHHCNNIATTLQPAVFPFPEDVHTTTSSITNHNQATVGGRFAQSMIIFIALESRSLLLHTVLSPVPASILKGLFFILIRMDHSRD